MCRWLKFFRSSSHSLFLDIVKARMPEQARATPEAVLNSHEDSRLIKAFPGSTRRETLDRPHPIERILDRRIYSLIHHGLARIILLRSKGSDVRQWSIDVSKGFSDWSVPLLKNSQALLTRVLSSSKEGLRFEVLGSLWLPWILVGGCKGH